MNRTSRDSTPHCGSHVGDGLMPATCPKCREAAPIEAVAHEEVVSGSSHPLLGDCVFEVRRPWSPAQGPTMLRVVGWHWIRTGTKV